MVDIICRHADMQDVMRQLTGQIRKYAQGKSVQGKVKLSNAYIS
jgi:hypothetical protein